VPVTHRNESRYNATHVPHNVPGQEGAPSGITLASPGADSHTPGSRGHLVETEVCRGGLKANTQCKFLQYNATHVPHNVPGLEGTPSGITLASPGADSHTPGHRSHLVETEVSRDGLKANTQCKFLQHNVTHVPTTCQAWRGRLAESLWPHLGLTRIRQAAGATL
jgi:hypothetical protein